MIEPFTLLLAQANNTQGNENTLLIWAIVLIGLAVGLFFLEILVPSGGLLGVVSATSLVVGVILLFEVDRTWGLVGAIVSLLALPFAMGFAIRIWPHTPIGRLLTLDAPATQSEPSPAGPKAAGAETDELVVGARGRAVTEMRPVGTCVFEGRREECLAIDGLVDPGTPVEVVAIDGRQIKVRAAAG